MSLFPRIDYTKVAICFDRSWIPAGSVQIRELKQEVCLSLMSEGEKQTHDLKLEALLLSSHLRIHTTKLDPDQVECLTGAKYLVVGCRDRRFGEEGGEEGTAERRRVLGRW